MSDVKLSPQELLALRNLYPHHVFSSSEFSAAQSIYLAAAANNAPDYARRLVELREIVPELMEDLLEGRCVTRASVERVNKLLRDDPECVLEGK